MRYMITEAIWEEKKWQKGSSRTDIRKFIEKNYDVDESKLKAQLSSNFAKMLQEGDKGYACLLKRKEDDTENYKLTPEWRKEWTKKYGKKQKRTRKAKKDPNHPKHPKNGYLYFSQEVRKKRQDQNPDKGFKEITTLVAEEWRNLSASKKKKYLDLAKKDRARYQQEMKDYKGESESASSSESESERKKRKRAKRSDDEESKSHSAKKRKSRSKTTKSDSGSDSDEDDKKKKSSEKQTKTPTKAD